MSKKNSLVNIRENRIDDHYNWTDHLPILVGLLVFSKGRSPGSCFIALLRLPKKFSGLLQHYSHLQWRDRIGIAPISHFNIRFIRITFTKIIINFKAINLLYKKIDIYQRLIFQKKVYFNHHFAKLQKNRKEPYHLRSLPILKNCITLIQELIPQLSLMHLLMLFLLL